MDLYILRHGETNYNVERRYQGMWGESQLTENGKAQAEAAHSLFDGIPFDFVHVSSSVRTRETAALLYPERNDFIFSDDLREIDTGILTNRLLADCKAIYSDELAKTLSIGFKAFNGESTEDVSERAKAAIERICRMRGKNVLIISHGSFIRYLLSALLQIPHATFALCDNCAAAHVSIKEGSQPLLQYYNRIARASIANTGVF